jgi:hypothetical protein
MDSLLPMFLIDVLGILVPDAFLSRFNGSATAGHQPAAT